MSCRSMCELSRRFDPDFPLNSTQLQEEVCAITREDTEIKQGDVLQRMRRRAGTEALKCLVGSTLVNGSDLPSHSDSHVSTISKIKITASVLVLTILRSSNFFYFKQNAKTLSAHAIGAGGLGFKSLVAQIGTVSPTAPHRCNIPSELCSPALSDGDGPRHSLHASA